VWNPWKNPWNPRIHGFLSIIHGIELLTGLIGKRR